MKRANHSTNEPQPIDRRRFLRRVGAVGSVCLTVPVLAGCEILAARADNRFTVAMTNKRRFEPASLTIPLGGTVVWDNTGYRVHSVTTDGSDIENSAAIALPVGVQPWDSGTLYPGETWALRFTIPGAYVYVCRYHHDEGMIGTIIVEE